MLHLSETEIRKCLPALFSVRSGVNAAPLRPGLEDLCRRMRLMAPLHQHGRRETYESLSLPFFQEPDRSLGDWIVRWSDADTSFVQERLFEFVEADDNDQVGRRAEYFESLEHIFTVHLQL